MEGPGFVRASLFLGPTFERNVSRYTFAPMQKLRIQHVDSGRTIEVTPYAWDLMRSKGASGDVRKGYKLLGNAPADGKKAEAVPVLKSVQPTFIPKEIEEAERERVKRETAEQSAMISGTTQPAEEASAPAAEATQQDAPAADAPKEQAPPAQAAPQVEETKAAVEGEEGGDTSTPDDLTVINGITAKVAEVLAAAGVRTYAELASKAPNEINQALVKANLAAKAALVPNWRVKAAELAQATTK